MRKFLEASFMRNPLTIVWCGDCDLSLRANPKYKMCNKCRNEILKVKREAEKRDNLARYLLKKSCQRALDRASKRKGYLRVKSQWSHWENMMLALMGNDVFWSAWCKQTEGKYRKIQNRLDTLEEGTKRYQTTYKALQKARPTLDRINPGGIEGEGGDYTLENIQCLPHQKNVQKDSVKAYFLFQDGNHKKIMSQTKLQNLIKDLDSKGIEYEYYRTNDLKVIIKLNMTIKEQTIEELNSKIKQMSEKMERLRLKIGIDPSVIKASIEKLRKAN